MLRFKADDGSDFPDWEEKTLGNEGKFYGGLSGKDKKDFETGDACFVTYMNVYKNTFARQDMAGCVSVGAGEKQNKVLCGDLLFTQSSETVEEVGLSSVYLHDDEPYLNSFCMGYRFNNPKEVCPKFIGYCMRSDGVRKSIMPMGQGISRINLSAKRLETVSFRIPSLPEQRKIADLLSTVDSVIAAQQAEADAWEQRKKGVMQKLFSQEVRFKADDGSDFPDWKKKKLGEICEYGRQRGIGDHYVGTENMLKDFGGITINDPEAEASGSLYFQGDTLMSNIRPYLKKAWKANCNGACSTDVLVFHPTNVESDYLYCVIASDSFVTYVMSAAKGSKMPRGDKTHIMQMPLILPSLPEQRKIADCLSSIDDVIAKEKAELTKWQELKKGLLQQMFV